MQKEKVRQCLEDYQIELIADLQSEFDNKAAAVIVDEVDVRDADTHSHQSQAQVEEQKYNDRLVSAKEQLVHLRTLNHSSSDHVLEGALIETSKLLIYVGIMTQKLTVNGQDIIGISTDAPIFKTLFNQKVGFPFKFGEVDCEILSIQ